MSRGLAPRSVAKYHVMLRSVFARAVRDRLIAFNPCEDTELPKVVIKPAARASSASAGSTAIAFWARGSISIE